MLADELGDSPIPATTLLERHLSAGRDTPVTLRLKVTGPDPHPGVRPLEDGEKDRLGAPGIAQCFWRTGLLLIGDSDEIAAVTTLMWLPARLTLDACLDLASGTVPAGQCLPGMRRADPLALALSERESERHPAEGLPGDLDLDIAVTASAVLIVGGWRAAIATERIPREVIDLLARQGLGQR